MKKLLPIFGLLLLVSCNVEETGDCLNGDKSACERAAKVERAEIKDWVKITDFLVNKTCSLSSIDITDEEVELEGGEKDISFEEVAGFNSTLDLAENRTGTSGMEYKSLTDSLVSGDGIRMTVSASEDGSNNTVILGLRSYTTELGAFSMRGKFKLFNDGVLEVDHYFTRLNKGPHWKKYIGSSELTEEGIDFKYTITCK